MANPVSGLSSRNPGSV